MNDMPREDRDWKLISSHGFVFLYVAANPASTVRAIAGAVEITERQVARVLRDLREEGLIEQRRAGRRNVYEVNPEARFRHPLLSHVYLERLIETLRPELSRTSGNRA